MTTDNELWERLTQEEKEALLEKYRYVNTGYESWGSEDIVCQAKEEMDAIGFEVDQVYWSGFSSQGDGACFTGRVSCWDKFIVAAGLPQLAQLIKVVSLVPLLQVRQSGHYCHAYSTRFDTALEVDNPYDQDTNPLRHAAWDNLYGDDGPFLEHEETFITFLRGKMNDLYRRLEEEYDYQTSDKAVQDYILGHLEPEELSPAEEEELPSTSNRSSVQDSV